jgi:hypothetical protein
MKLMTSHAFRGSELNLQKCAQKKLTPLSTDVAIDIPSNGS